MGYIPTSTIKKDYSKRGRTPFVLLLATVVLFALAYTFQAVYLTDARLGAETAHAEEPEKIHQNDYYCQQIINGSMRVNPQEVSANQLLQLCAQYL